LKKYTLVDTDGQPFADAALSEREDNRQLGANNFWLAPHFIKRLAHLGYGFANVDQLIEIIETYIAQHNTNPKPFVWTAKASDILEKVKRARASSHKLRYAAVDGILYHYRFSKTYPRNWKVQLYTEHNEGSL
jgi:hypothetical protein